VHGWQAKAADKGRKKLRLEDAKEVSTSKPTTLPLTAAASTPENNPTMTPADVEKLEDKVKLAQTRAKGDAKLSRQEFLREKSTAKTRETSAPDRESALRATSKPKDADGRRVHFAKGANGEAGVPEKDPRKVVAKMEKGTVTEEKENMKEAAVKNRSVKAKSAPKRKAAAKKVTKKAEIRDDEESNTLDSEEHLSDDLENLEDSESAEPEVEKAEARKKVEEKQKAHERKRVQLERAEARKKVAEKEKAEERTRLQLEKAEALRKEEKEKADDRKRLQLEKAEARRKVEEKKKTDERQRLQLEKAEARKRLQRRIKLRKGSGFSWRRLRH
jgi:hypothetical protein